MLKRMRSFLVVVMLLITATMSAQVTTASMSGKVTVQSRNHLCRLSVSHLQGHPVVIRRKLRIECFFERKFRVVG